MRRQKPPAKSVSPPSKAALLMSIMSTCHLATTPNKFENPVIEKESVVGRPPSGTHTLTHIYTYTRHTRTHYSHYYRNYNGAVYNLSRKWTGGADEVAVWSQLLPQMHHPMARRVRLSVSWMSTCCLSYDRQWWNRRADTNATATWYQYLHVRYPN